MRRRIAPTNSRMASTIRECYRISPVDGNLYPVEISVGQSFGEPQLSVSKSIWRCNDALQSLEDLIQINDTTDKER
jgi:hypothetical protein